MEELYFERLSLDDIAEPTDINEGESVLTRNMRYDDLPQLLDEDAVHPDEWYERRCLELWPHTKAYKLALERRMSAGILTWRQFYYETEHIRTVLENREDHAVPVSLMKFSTYESFKRKSASKRTKHHSTKESEPESAEMVITALGISEVVAAVLCRPYTESEKAVLAAAQEGQAPEVKQDGERPCGKLWILHTPRFGEGPTKWHDTGVSITGYITCWINANIIYIVTEVGIRVYKVAPFPRIDRLFTLAFGEHLPGYDVSKITVFRAHDKLAVLVATSGFVVWLIGNGMQRIYSQAAPAGAQYTAATLDGNALFVGRSDGLLEVHKLAKNADDTEQFEHSETLNWFVDRVTSNSAHQPVKMKPEPIQCVHADGTRIMVTSEHNVVMKECSKPRYTLAIDDVSTVVSTSFFGHMLCSLERTGGFYITRFASGVNERSTIEAVPFVGPEGLQIGLQRTAFLGSLALALLDSGHIVGLDMQNKRKNRHV